MIIGADGAEPKGRKPRAREKECSWNDIRRDRGKQIKAKDVRQPKSTRYNRNKGIKRTCGLSFWVVSVFIYNCYYQ